MTKNKIFKTLVILFENWKTMQVDETKLSKLKIVKVKQVCNSNDDQN